MAQAAHDPPPAEEESQLRARIAQLEQEVAHFRSRTPSPHRVVQERGAPPPVLQALLSQGPWSHAFWQPLLDSLSDAVYSVDREGHIFFCNAAFSRLTGYPLDVLLGCPSLDLYTLEHAPVFLERRQRVACGQAVQPRLEADICRKDGARIPVELSVTSLLHDGQVVGGVTVVRDVREWQQSEVQLHQTQQLEAMGFLAGGFAHHFNNMLMGILGFTELMLAEEVPGSARWNNLQHVFTAAFRARDLVQQLLAFSRPTPLLRRPMHFSGLLRDTVTGLRAALPATMTLQPAIPDDPSYVLGDAMELHQVIVQLWANAVDAMQQAGGVLDVRLDRIDVDTAPEAIAPAVQPGAYVRCTIRDTGPGIPPDLLDHIFEPFFTTKAPGTGTEMGLAIVQRIVASHEGHITVSSGGGAGATFVVYLPRLVPAMVRMLQEGLPEEEEPRGRGR